MTHGSLGARSMHLGMFCTGFAMQVCPPPLQQRTWCVAGAAATGLGAAVAATRKGGNSYSFQRCTGRMSFSL